MEGMTLPTIPERITVHLGPPDEEAENVEINFIDYINNVASSVLYPDMPESALIANILAFISFAINRVNDGYYRSRGYNFDITNSEDYDQPYVYNGHVYENISYWVNKYFSNYIKREGNLEPVLSKFCSVTDENCSGISVMKSVELANQGYSPIDILKYFYGDDIEISEKIPVKLLGIISISEELNVGSEGNNVRVFQTWLNRISTNFSSIPKIGSYEFGIYAAQTQNAVKEFQRIFGLDVTGAVDSATWYKVAELYGAIYIFTELISRGLQYENHMFDFSSVLKKGDRGLNVSAIQYYLNIISQYVDIMNAFPITGEYDASTEEQVKIFQNYFGIPVTGEIDETTRNMLYYEYIGILKILPPAAFYNLAGQYPERLIVYGDTGEYVSALQTYINTLADVYPEIAHVETNAIFGDETLNAVKAIQKYFGDTVNGIVDSETWGDITQAFNGIILAKLRSEGIYSGYQLE